jgi:hypothetical protein
MYGKFFLFHTSHAFTTNWPYMFRNFAVLFAKTGKFSGASCKEYLHFLSQTSYSNEVISQNLLWKQFSLVS